MRRLYLCYPDLQAPASDAKRQVGVVDLPSIARLVTVAIMMFLLRYWADIKN